MTRILVVIRNGEVQAVKADSPVEVWIDDRFADAAAPGGEDRLIFQFEGVADLAAGDLPAVPPLL